MRRIDRIEQLVWILRSRDELTMGEIAEELEVSARTIRRDVELLRVRGLDIEAERGRGGGIRLSRHAPAAPVRLNEDELVALVLGVELARRVAGLPFAHASGAAIDKVLASLPATRRAELRAVSKRVRVGSRASPGLAASAGEVSPALLPRFEQAFTGRRCLTFRYRDRHGRASRRTVEPHGLLVRQPVWYILAHDRLRDAPRMFRMDRIQQPKVLAATFTPRRSVLSELS